MKIKILSWNICCLPYSMNLYHNPNLAINKIINFVINSGCDIIKLQEVFELSIKKKIIKELKKNDYNIHTTTKENSYISTDGLLTATKFNICKKNSYFYKNNTSVELLVEKGIISTEIKIPNYGNIICHNTHMQSDSVYGLENLCKKYRNYQLVEMLNYYEKFDNKKQILSGDLNDNYNDEKLNEMFDNMNFSKNDKKIITFPKNRTQLDYIVYNFKLKSKPEYYINKTKLSDHYPIFGIFHL